MPLPAGYAIRAALDRDIPALPGIERAASRLFVGLAVLESVEGDVTSEADLREASEEGCLFVACGPDDAPVGFALVDELEGSAHLDEIDVHPDHGRRGLGAALVRTVCDAARERGYGFVTLTTFREVAWNAPFYAALGFEALDPENLGTELAALFAEEDSAGLRAADRVVMRFETGAGAQDAP